MTARLLSLVLLLAAGCGRTGPPPPAPAPASPAPGPPVEPTRPSDDPGATTPSGDGEEADSGEVREG